MQIALNRNVSVGSIQSQEELAVSRSEVKSRSHSSSRHSTPVSERSVLGSHFTEQSSFHKKTVCKHSKPVLSVRIGPSFYFQPEPKILSRSPMEIIDIPPACLVDVSVSAKPRRSSRGTQTCFDSIGHGTDCGPLGTTKGTKPSSSSSFTPEPPAIAVTQGHSSSSLPGRPVSSKGTATQGHPSTSFSSSVPRDPDEEESGDEAGSDSIVLEDSDPETELLSASESYTFLKAQIVGKYSSVKSESKVVERLLLRRPNQKLFLFV